MVKRMADRAVHRAEGQVDLGDRHREVREAAQVPPQGVAVNEPELAKTRLPESVTIHNRFGCGSG
jgi:hypothetical protein